MKEREISDITMILTVMLLGSLTGIIIGKPTTYIGFIRDIWLNLMEMFLVSIMVCTFVKGVNSMDSPEVLGRIGIKIIVFYIFTIICAGALGIGATSILNPGSDFSYEAVTEEIVVSKVPTITEFFKSMFSNDISATFPSGDMMQVAIVSCIIGIAIVLLPEGRRGSVRDWSVTVNNFVISIINIASKPASIGIFCLMVSSLGKYGVGLLITIGKILDTFYLCCVLHLIVVHCLLLWMLTGISPITFIRKAFSTLTTVVSTCSSNAVIPVSMEVATQNSGCDESMASLGIPLGATANKDGIVVLCSVALVFSGQAVGIPLTIAQIISMLSITTSVASTGSDVPGGELMNLMIVGTAAGMPLDIVLMMRRFYCFFDTGTTSMNCLNDMSAIVIVDRMEKHRITESGKKNFSDERENL